MNYLIIYKIKKMIKYILKKHYKNLEKVVKYFTTLKMGFFLKNYISHFCPAAGVGYFL
jgi:hypothetical protein